MRSHYDWLLAMGVLGLLPLLVVQCGYLASRKHLQFFPLAWLFFLTLIYLRGAPSGSLPRWRLRLGELSFVVAVSIAALAVSRFSPWLAHVALAVLVFAWMQVRLVGNRWTQLVSWCGLMLLTIPLPLNGDTLLIQRLQALATQSASQLLDLAHSPHMARGNVLEIRTGELFVDEACSGVDSLYSLAAIAVMLIVWQQRSFLSGVLTLALVPLWAWLGNLIRIFAIAIMLDRFDINWTHGWPHTVLGLALFAGSFACMLFAQSAITLVLEPFPVEAATTSFVHRWYDRCVSWPGQPSTVSDEPLEHPQALASQSSRRWRIGYTAVLATLYLVLGAISALPIMGVGPWRSRIEMLPSWTKQQVSDLFVATDLPQDFSGFKLFGFAVTHRETGSVFGEHSATWAFQHTGQPIQVSLDFPFSGLHELESCYVAAGMQVNLPVVTTSETIDDFNVQVHEVNLIDDLKQTSFLWYLSYDADGVPVTKLKSAMWGGALAVPPVAFQVQLLVSDCGELTEPQRTLYRHVLVHAAKELLPKIQTLPDLR